MPKVYSSKYERKIAAFRKWFSGRRASEGISQEDLARKMGIGQASVSAKIKVAGYDQTNLTYKDLLILFDAVNATDQEILHYMRIGRREEE